MNQQQQIYFAHATVTEHGVTEHGEPEEPDTVQAFHREFLAISKDDAKEQMRHYVDETSLHCPASVGNGESVPSLK
jgi:hypothetical protein